MSDPQHPELEPSSEFQQFLEWQLRSELRRASRFGAQGETPMRTSGQTLSNGTRSKLARRTGVVTLALLTLAVGAAGGVAAVRLAEDDGDRELLLARARLELELAERKLQLETDGLAEAEALAAQGFVGQGELLAEHAAIEARRAAVLRLTANLEEIELTGAAPRDELWAPLVQKRDFVSERMRLGVEHLEREVEVTRVRLEWAEQLYAQGMLHDSELFADQATLARASRDVELLLDRMELRLRFLSGELTAAEVEVEERLVTLQVHFHGLEESLERARHEHERLQVLVESGVANTRELAETKLRLVELEGQLKLARVELKLLHRERERVRALAGRAPAEETGGGEER